MSVQVRLLQLSGEEREAIPLPWTTGFYNVDKTSDLWLYRLNTNSEDRIVEFVFTPYHRQVWQDLWSVSITVSDRPGILNRLAGFFQDRKINIITMNSSALEHGKYHALRIVIDCTKYDHNLDGKHRKRKELPNANLNHLYRELTLDFIREVRFFNPNYPSLSIYRLMTLWRLFHHSRLNSMGPGKIQKLRKEIGSVFISKEDIERIRTSYIKQYRVEVEADRELYGLVSVNSSSDVVRVIPFYKNFGIIPLSVSLSNEPGAIAALTNVLSNNGYNIIGSKAWTSERQSRSSLWMLIQDLNQNSYPCDDGKIKEKMIRKLKRSKSLEKYGSLTICVVVVV